MHLPRYLSELKKEYEQGLIDLDARNEHSNNPVEHFLHLNLYPNADYLVKQGATFNRTLGEELVKALDEYLDLDRMHPYKYQILLNILYHKVFNDEERASIPENVLKYVDDSTNYVFVEEDKPCATRFKDGFLEDMAWVRPHLDKVAKYLIQASLEEQVRGVHEEASQERSLLTKLYNPNTNLDAIGDTLNDCNPDSSNSYLGKLLSANKDVSSGEMFIKLYSDISHNLNTLIAQENAMMNAIPLAYSNEDITVYRGLRITDLSEVDNWFKYGYESTIAQEFVPKRGFVEKYGYAGGDDGYSVCGCRDSNKGAGFCSDISGFNAGVVYTSTSIPMTKPFIVGKFTELGHRKEGYGVLLKIKVPAEEVHLKPYKSECAVHMPSLKAENIVAAYVINAEDVFNDIVTHKFINPYIAESVLDFDINDLNDFLRYENEHHPHNHRCPNFELFKYVGDYYTDCKLYHSGVRVAPFPEDWFENKKYYTIPAISEFREHLQEVGNLKVSGIDKVAMEHNVDEVAA